MTDILAAVRWWAALTLLGLVAWPLVYSLLRPLPDRGYAFVKMAGLLLVSYIFWLGGTLGFAANNAGGILLALLVVGGASLLAYRRRAPGDASLAGWLRDHRAEVIVTELVFAAVFALWVWVRAQNPSITATEKPMEFAFLNGVGRSAAFPPLDPWLSGYSISYYYFGYVMTSLLARLAFVTESVAFNLAIAWLVAGTAVGAYGVVFNLIRATSDERRATNEEGAELVTRRSSLVTRAVLLGLVAAAAVPIAGNLQIGLEVLHGNGVGSAGLWAWLDVRDINTPPADESVTPRYETSEWWWWRTSRVIHEYHLSGRAEEGLEPIVEVPAFSFVLGDMHPHVLALPFAFLSLGVALAWWLRTASDERRTTGLVEAIRQPLRQIGLPLWVLTAIVLGGLSFLNTWDVLIHLFVVMGVYFLAEWYRDLSGRGTPGRSIWSLLGRTLLVGLSLGVVAGLLYLPFYLGFRSQAGPPFLLPMLMRPTRLAHYLIIFGMPLLVIVVFLVTLAARQRFRHWRVGLGVAAGVVGGLLLLMLLLLWIVASSASSAGTIINLAGELGRELPARPDALIAPGWGLSAMTAILPAWFAARLVGPWLTLLLAGLLALVVMALRGAVEERNPQISQITPIQNEGHAGMSVNRPSASEDADSARSPAPLLPRSPALPFALLLILAGLLLTLVPEFVYLRDNFGVRLNTTFKFYYQAWVMFGVAAVYAIDYLWTAAIQRRGANRAVAAATTAGYLALLAVALLFPIFAVQSRAAEYRGPARAADGSPLERQPATLDGLAYLQRFNPAEYDAIQWLRQNAATADGAPPVVLEAVGGQYSGYGRVSANTGLPTVLGWPGHESQWRGSDHPEPGRREPIVEQIYTATDLGVVGFLLDQFDVAYIFVGDLEVSAYGEDGLAKFREGLDVAYANDRVTIYRWQPVELSSR